MSNASLSANLERAFTGNPVEEKQVMDNPFPPITFGQGNPTAQATGPSLGMSMYEGMDFPQIAKALNVDTNGIHGNQELGRLQLMNRLQKQFGPDYMQRDEIQKLLTAFAKTAKKDRASEQQLMSTNAKADRTLAALMGKT